MVLLLAALSMSAQQDETLFFNVNRIGVFGGPIFEFSEFNEEITSSTGGGGGVVLNDFFFGGYGSGDIEIDGFDLNTTELEFNDINLKHRGIWVGFTPKQSKAIHPYLSGRIGWGRMSFRQSEINGNNNFERRRDQVFVLTPEIGLEFNVFRWFRVAAAANYRYLNGLENANPLTDDDLSNFGGVITLRFGWFGHNFWWD